MPLNSLLIGLGQIGLTYDIKDSCINLASDQVRTHAKSLYFNPDFNLIAGIDPISQNRELFSNTFQLPAFMSLDEAFDNLKFNHLDLVTIAVPPYLQFSVLSDLYQFASPKVILLEKPICGLDDNIHQIEDLISTHSPYTSFFVNYHRNYLPQTGQVTRLIKSGQLGDLIYGSLLYGKGLMMNGSHYLSLLRSFLGDVYDFRVTRSSPCIYSFDREVDFTLRYNDHPHASLNAISVGKNFRRMGEIDLIFENARLKWIDGDKFIHITYIKDARTVSDTHLPYVGSEQRFDLNSDTFIPSVYKQIYSSLNNPVSTNTCSFHHGLETFKLVKLILEQA